MNNFETKRRGIRYCKSGKSFFKKIKLTGPITNLRETNITLDFHF